MQTLVSALPFIQIVLALLLVGGILLQQRGAGLGGAFGGGDGFGAGTRRGPEKIIFVVTITLAILFVLSALISLFLS